MNKLTKALAIPIAISILISASLFTSCKPNVKNTEANILNNAINEVDIDDINSFAKEYFAQYNVKFIENTDDANFNISDLNFHTWAWQKYLHLTQNIDSTGARHNTPLFLFDKKISQVTPDGDPLPYLDKKLKLDLYKQAGSTSPILNSNPNFANKTSYTVFYSIHMNSIMYKDMVDGANKILQSSKETKPIKDTIKVSNSDLKYRDGALEIKAAWIDVEAIPENLRKDYLIVEDVRILDLKSTSQNKQTYLENRKVALIGLHIVGMVNGFPELLWTTFEGKHLAPDNLHNLTDSVSKKINSNNKNNKIITHTDNEWLLYRAGSTEISKEIDYSEKVITYMNFIEMDNNANNFQVYRKFPLSIDINHFQNNSEESKNFVNHANLMNDLNLKSTLYNNIKMTYNANIWMRGNTQHEKFENLIELKLNKKADKNKLVAGSPNATNVTLESYMQNTQCFTCHGADFNVAKLSYDIETTINIKSFLGTSHVFRDYFVKIYLLDKRSNTNKLFQYSPENIRDIIERVKTANEIEIESRK